MKSLVSLLKNVLLDIEDACCVSTSRDLKTIMARIEEEGDSFLTISLSNYGSDLQKGLDRGYVAHDLFQGFSRTGALPKLFSGLLELIFDRVTGRLLDVPDVDAILYLRQISLMWAKIARPTTEKRNRAAISKYMDCERDVRESDLYVGPGTGSRSDLGRISSLLFREVLYPSTEWSIAVTELSLDMDLDKLRIALWETISTIYQYGPAGLSMSSLAGSLLELVSGLTWKVHYASTNLEKNNP